MRRHPVALLTRFIFGIFVTGGLFAAAFWDGSEEKRLTLSRTRGPPGGSDWTLTPLSKQWQDLNDRPLSSAAVCRSVTDRAKNEHMDGPALLKHHEQAELVLWAWHPGVRPDGTARTLPPLTHEEFVAATRQWVEAGTPCPKGK